MRFSPTRPWPVPGLAVLLLLVPLLSAAPSVARAEALGVEAAVAEALLHNPDLLAREAAARAVAETPPRAGALPDPMLMLGAMSVPVDNPSLSREDMTQVSVGITQMLPFPGKRGLMRRAAGADALAAGEGVVEARLELVSRVQQAWWSLFSVERGLDLVRQTQVLMRQFVDIAQTRYKVGRGLQQDVLLAQVEYSKLIDSELGLERDRIRQQSELNALMGRPTEQLIELPDSVDEKLGRTPVPAWLMALAESARPRLAEARHRVAEAEAMLALARREHLPDVTVSGAYEWRAGTDAAGMQRPESVSVTLAVPLPVHYGSRQRRLVAERRQELDMRQRELAAARLDVQDQITRLATDYDTGRRQVELLSGGIIPQASQMVASMVSGYQVNKVDFLNLVGAQMTLLEYQIRYWNILAETRSAWVKLNSAVGAEVGLGVQEFPALPTRPGPAGPAGPAVSDQPVPPAPPALPSGAGSNHHSHPGGEQ